MANLIKIKRGLKQDLPILEIGELAFCTDTKELFIGRDDGNSGVENVLISNIDDFYTKSEIESLAGTGLTWDSGNSVFDIDNPFDPSGDYTNLRAQATTAADVGLENVTNESKTTMFTDPTFTGTVNGVTASMVGLGNVTNESKATMFTDPTFTGNVTVPTPTQASNPTTKSYVDNLVEGLKVRPNVEVATTADLGATYDNNAGTLTASANSAFPEIDGYTVDSVNTGTNGVLVKDQSNAEENGIYYLTQLGDASNPWILTRCDFCDEVAEITGSYVFVAHGTLYGSTGWVLQIDPEGVIGTDPIDVIQFSGEGTYLAGTGLELSGNEFSADIASTAEAEAGTDDTKLMTPLKTAQAITELSPSPNNGTLTVQGNSGLTGSGTFTADQDSNETITLSHADTSSQGSVNNSGNTFIQDVTLDTYGHVTDLVSGSISNVTATNVDNLNSASNLTFWTGTQSEYDNLTPDANTLYFITD